MSRDARSPPAAAVRICVFSALEYARELATEASDEIGIGLHDEDPNVRLAAARLLAWVASSDDLVLAARQSLADPVWSVRWHAVRALATWKAVAPDDLAATLLSTAPTSRFVDDWIRAAESVDPMPSELAGRVDELRKQPRA